MEQAADLKSAGAITSNSGVRVPSPIPIWRCGVIGNMRDSDSLVLGSRPDGAANMASSYNGSIGDFESFGVGSTPSLAGRVICRASPWCAMDNAKFYKIGRFLYFYLPKSTYI